MIGVSRSELCRLQRNCCFHFWMHYKKYKPTEVCSKQNVFFSAHIKESDACKTITKNGGNSNGILKFMFFKAFAWVSFLDISTSSLREGIIENTSCQVTPHSLFSSSLSKTFKNAEAWTADSSSHIQSGAPSVLLQIAGHIVETRKVWFNPIVLRLIQLFS